MGNSNLIRVLIMNFITSLIIAIVTSDIFYTFNLMGGMYLGNLFGLYFLVVYGVNNIIEARKIPNNYLRFVLVILYILIFDIAFIIIIPLLFGPNAFPAPEILSLGYGGGQLDILLSREFYLVLFAIVMLLFNFLIYRRHIRHE